MFFMNYIDKIDIKCYNYLNDLRERSILFLFYDAFTTNYENPGEKESLL